MIDLVRLFASSPFRLLLFLPFRSLLLVQESSEDRELPGPYVFRDDAPASADLPVVVLTASPAFLAHCATPPLDPRLQS